MRILGDYIDSDSSIGRDGAVIMEFVGMVEVVEVVEVVEEKEEGWVKGEEPAHALITE